MSPPNESHAPGPRQLLLCGKVCPFLPEMFCVSGVILAFGCLWVTVTWMLVDAFSSESLKLDASAGSFILWVTVLGSMAEHI